MLKTKLFHIEHFDSSDIWSLIAQGGKGGSVDSVAISKEN